ncbi:unnamed protein product [Porites evermanni]|uniref:Uncharacterized protein n=1 Tax=Porites evermanni TaxID=104178 RepID=A0ABN8MBX8_9CNID|nr:unnamed protein product [Porites evermanni]
MFVLCSGYYYLFALVDEGMAHATRNWLITSRPVSLKLMLVAMLVAHASQLSSFEVTINGKLVYSKLSQGAFPVFKEIVQVVHECSEGKEPREVTEKEPNSCILM